MLTADCASLSTQYLGFFTAMDRMTKKDRRQLLVYLCDGYASANFGYEGGDDQNRTLDEADSLKFLADRIAKSLGVCEFDHYTLEEIYQYPIGKYEKPEERMKALKGRAPSYFKSDLMKSATAALGLARQVIQFYNAHTKAKYFWADVIDLLAIEAGKERS